MSVNNVDLPMNLVQTEDYDLLTYEAQRIVDLVLAESLEHVRATITTEDNQNHEQHPNESDEWKVESKVQWPTIAEFTDENIGLEKIQEYIETEWKTSPGGQDVCWLYAIDFIEKKVLEFNDLYIYRVRYSIPTRRQPIPRQTASIYFSLNVSRVKPKDSRVQVAFTIETMRVLHTPDKFRFRQTWLENIILLKEKLSNAIDF